VLEARRRHKFAAILIHELAHSLGALQRDREVLGDEPQLLRTSRATISDRNRELMMSHARGPTEVTDRPRSSRRAAQRMPRRARGRLERMGSGGARQC